MQSLDKPWTILHESEQTPPGFDLLQLTRLYNSFKREREGGYIAASYIASSFKQCKINSYDVVGLMALYD